MIEVIISCERNGYGPRELVCMPMWNGECQQATWRGSSQAEVGRKPCYSIGQIR